MKNIGQNSALLLLLFAPSAYALDANSSLVDQIEISTSQDCNQLMFYFYAPVVYLNQFPLSKNKLFQVRIKTIYDDKEAHRKQHVRHSISIPKKPESPLLEITYEDDDSEPYFIIEFDRDVNLNIQQTKDHRNLQLRFSDTEKRCALNKPHTK